MVAYAYLRCSHRLSAESGAGLAAQAVNIARMFEEAQIMEPGLKWADASFEHESKGHFCDRKVSAFRTPMHKRPAGSALLKVASKGDVIFVSAVDRMFRSIADMAKCLQQFDSRGIRLRFANMPVDTSTPVGRLVLHQLVVFAEWESSLKSVRHKEANAIRKALAAKGKGVPKEMLSPGDYERPSEEFTGLKSKAPQFDPGVLETIPRRAQPIVVSKDTPGRVFTYVRCSHTDSAESGLGIDAQRRATSAFAARLCEAHPNMTLGGDFCDEAVSAWKHRFEKRPQGGELSRMLRPGDHVVFSRLDRAFRSVRDMSDVLPRWQEQGITVSFVTEGVDSRTAWGRAAIGVLAVFAQLEPEITSSRTREALHELRSHGRGLWRAWGFRWSGRGNNRTLVPCRTTTVKIRLAHWLHFQFKWSPERIAVRIEELTAKREGRRPLPMSGIHPYFAEKWFGPGVKANMLSTSVYTQRGTNKKMQPMILPEFSGRQVLRAIQRWPLLAKYHEEQRREAQRLRASRRSQESADIE